MKPSHSLLLMLLCGALLLAVVQVRASLEDARTIRVSEEFIQAIRHDHESRLGRTISPKELRHAVRTTMDQEILVRQAIELGLDQGDPIIRRRLDQKMRALLEATDPVPAPTNQEIDAYIKAHPHAYALPQQRTVEHVFLGSDPPDHDPTALLLDRLRDGKLAASTLGKPFAAGHRLGPLDDDALGAMMGQEFLRGLRQAPAESWQGPVASKFGWHFVRQQIHKMPPSEFRHQRARTDLHRERRAHALTQHIERLRATYHITWPEEPGGEL